jgi:hypothetical protein
MNINKDNLKKHTKNLSEFLLTKGFSADELSDPFFNFSDAIIQIKLGQGRYQKDPLTHASNTIEDMVKLARMPFL